MATSSVGSSASPAAGTQASKPAENNERNDPSHRNIRLLRDVVWGNTMPVKTISLRI